MTTKHPSKADRGVPPGTERAAAAALTPWIATGRATAEQRAVFEREAKLDPSLARELERARLEVEAAYRSAEALGSAGAGALDRLMAGVARAPSQIASQSTATERPAGFIDRLSIWLASLAPPRLAGLATAAAALLVVQTGIITYQLGQRPGGDVYTTASGSAPSATPSGQTHALVAFRSSAAASEIAEALDRLNAEIVAGPQAGATFRVRLALLPGESTDAALARLTATGITSLAVLAK